MPLSLYKINEYNKNNLNILVILGAKGPFFKEKYVKEQIKNIIGERDKLEIKVYENIAHNINNDGMNCLKEFVLKLLSFYMQHKKYIKLLFLKKVKYISYYFIFNILKNSSKNIY